MAQAGRFVTKSVVQQMIDASLANLGFSDNLNVFTYDITAQNETDKGFTLPTTPLNPEALVADIRNGGGALRYGIDYTIDGDQFKWEGLALDGLLAEGDEIRFQYFS